MSSPEHVTDGKMHLKTMFYSLPPSGQDYHRPLDYQLSNKAVKLCFKTGGNCP